MDGEGILKVRGGLEMTRGVSGSKNSSVDPCHARFNARFLYELSTFTTTIAAHSGGKVHIN
jgi:hypothetical protein